MNAVARPKRLFRQGQVQRGRKSLAIAGLLCASVAAAALVAPRADAQILDLDPWIMPFDVNQRFADDEEQPINRQEEVYDFIWRTFVALNWPQKEGGNRAEPDTTARLPSWDKTDKPHPQVVWNSYLRPSQVFVDPRTWNGSWNDPPATIEPLCPEAPPGTPIITSYATNYSDLSDGLNQPFIQANYPTGPVVDQNNNYLRYEVGINQAYFTYIDEFEYYRPRTQVRVVQNYIDFVEKKKRKPPATDRRFFQQLPTGTERYLGDLPDYALQGMVEWKAAWKVLAGDDKPERFYQREAFFLNPDLTCTGPFRVGLVAFHIHRFTKNGHFGATFEQVDNTRLQPAYSNREVQDAAPLPPHASLNPGGEVSPNYPNGYEICDENGEHCQSGQEGLLPKPIEDGELLLNNPGITNVVREVPIPDDVQAVNAEWRKRLEGTAFFYYQLIGTQNRNVNEEGVINRNLGPGVIGAQASNTKNLINTALESYTQEGWSCALCHQNAFPLGVSLPLPPIGQNFDILRTISFVLQNAANFSDDKRRKRRQHHRKYR